MRSPSSCGFFVRAMLALGCAGTLGPLQVACNRSKMVVRKDGSAPTDLSPPLDLLAPPVDLSPLDLPAADLPPSPQERPAWDSGVAPEEANLALGKPASQSSTYASGAGAASAVDGNTNGYFYDGSVTNTNADTYAWWQVDLQDTVAIDTIVVWNRTDSDTARLSDYWVFVSAAPFEPLETPTTLKSRVATWNSHQTTIPQPSTTIAVAGTAGRYVRVQLGRTEYLTLAEVEVKLSDGTNVALGKPASQSSTIAKGAVAASAVDGSTNGSFANGSVTNTNLDAYAWWQVDLGFSATISAIAIWNRTDCCGSRLRDYWVFVSESPFSAADTPLSLPGRSGVWSSHQTVVPNPSISIATGAVRGRYVRVQLSGTDYLNMAEVQVIGH